MNERRFVAGRIERWRELEGLLTRAQKLGLRRLPGADVRRLGALYRSAATDLAAFEERSQAMGKIVFASTFGAVFGPLLIGTDPLAIERA